MNQRLVNIVLALANKFTNGVPNLEARPADFNKFRLSAQKLIPRFAEDGWFDHRCCCRYAVIRQFKLKTTSAQLVNDTVPGTLS